MANNANFAAITNLLEKDIMEVLPYQAYQKAPINKLMGGYQPVNDNKTFYTENNVVPVGTKGTKMINNTLYFDIITGTAGGTGVMNPANYQIDYGYVPTQQGSVPLVSQYAAFYIPEAVLKTPGTIKDTFALYVQQATNAYAMNNARQNYSNGTGLIGTAAAAGASSTAFTFAPSTNGDIDYAQYFGKGSHIQVGSNTNMTVAAIAGKNAITLSSAVSWNLGDSVYMVAPDGTQVNEETGLQAMLGTGTYANITDPSWESHVTSSFGSFTSNDASTAMMSSFIRAGQYGNPRVIFMNASLFLDYGKSLVGDRRFLGKDAEIYDGWARLGFMDGSATVVLDMTAPDDSVFIVDPDSMWTARLDPLHWLPGESGTLRAIPGTANYEAIATSYDAIFCNVRTANALISGITK